MKSWLGQRAGWRLSLAGESIHQTSCTHNDTGLLGNVGIPGGRPLTWTHACQPGNTRLAPVNGRHGENGPVQPAATVCNAHLMVGEVTDHVGGAWRLSWSSQHAEAEVRVNGLRR